VNWKCNEGQVWRRALLVAQKYLWISSFPHTNNTMQLKLSPFFIVTRQQTTKPAIAITTTKKTNRNPHTKDKKEEMTINKHSKQSRSNTHLLPLLSITPIACVSLAFHYGLYWHLAAPWMRLQKDRSKANARPINTTNRMLNDQKKQEVRGKPWCNGLLLSLALSVDQ